MDPGTAGRSAGVPAGLLGATNNEQVIEILVTPDRNPRVNLRLEDRILKEVESGVRPETLRLWVNDICLVRGPNRSGTSGWHRIARAKQLGIPVYRRKTGGGTVYHDPGNLNWSFYLRRSEGFIAGARLHREWGEWMADQLEGLGVDAEFVAPNRIDASGYKISGMASRACFGAVLVHGTLLISTELGPLNDTCIPPPGCPPVANLADLVPGLTVERVIEHIMGASVTGAPVSAPALGAPVPRPALGAPVSRPALGPPAS